MRQTDGQIDGQMDGKSHIEVGAPPNNQIRTASYTDAGWNDIKRRFNEKRPYNGIIKFLLKIDKSFVWCS